MGGKRRKKKGKKPSPRKEISPSPKEIKPKPKKGRWFFIVFPLLVIGAISLILLPRYIVPRSKFPKANLLLISIDTMRADYLSCYAESGVKTPNIDRIAREGILFKNCSVQIPLTLPSHATLFTGRYPMSHGVYENIGYILPEKMTTLAEVLKKAGYTTAGFVGSVVIGSSTGIAQGFDLYDDTFSPEEISAIKFGIAERRADKVVDSYINWQKDHLGDRFFAFVHLFDPHAPYDPPEPYRSRYQKEKNGPYRGEVAFTDEQIGRIYQFLKEKGLLKKTIIVISGDHGEMLGEHNEAEHGYFIYHSAINVPLIIRLPEGNYRGRKIEAQVGNIDIMPTILSLLDIPAPKEVEGKSLIPLMRKPKTEFPRYAYSESRRAYNHFGFAILRGICDGRYHYIDAPKPELYDIKSDPFEERNLFQKEKERAKALKRKMEEIVRRYSRGEGSSAEVSPELAERIRALGYLSAPGARKCRGNLPDPKDFIDIYNEVLLAGKLEDEGKYEESLKIIDKVLETLPDNLEALLLKGRVLVAMHRFNKAIPPLTKVVELAPKRWTKITALSLLGKCYQGIGELERAIAVYREVLAGNYTPSTLGALIRLYKKSGRIGEGKRYLDALLSKGKLSASRLFTIGNMYELLNDYKKAEEVYRKVLEENPAHPGARKKLAYLLSRRGDLATALSLLEEGSRMSPNDGTYFLEMGLIYARMGRLSEEISAFRRAVELSPKLPQAYFYLGKALLDANGDPNEVIALAKKGLSLTPSPYFKPFGHYLLSDAYLRLGRRRESDAEYRIAKSLEEKLSRQPHP